MAQIHDNSLQRYEKAKKEELKTVIKMAKKESNLSRFTTLVSYCLSAFLRTFTTNIITLYQHFSRLTPPTCRFYPTCSEYMKQAIIKYGIFKGGWLGIKRICRCHPGNEGGYDPVP